MEIKHERKGKRGMFRSTNEKNKKCSSDTKGQSYGRGIESIFLKIN